MSAAALMQFGLYMAVLLVLAWPLGILMARLLREPAAAEPQQRRRIDGALVRILGQRSLEEMSWQRYASAVLWFSAGGAILVYLLQRLQHWLPLNPASLGQVSADSAFNTAISFVTNTNWQGYGGETTMSYLTQMLALAVQNFASAATGIAVLLALTRGFVREGVTTVGNFWRDLSRITLLVLLPLSVVLALLLVSQGVVQSFDGPVVATTLDGTTQTLPLGPAASQVAIKQLGTNGGGFFSVNSAHPFENPTPLSNLLQMLSILLIPAALCFTFGRLVGDVRQGRALLATMLLIFVPLTLATMSLEQVGTPALKAAGAGLQASEESPGGNMEGKEVRFGIANSAIWATATTAASNGSVNSMHDSFTPLGGLIPMWLMQLGEVIFGGVGSGLYGLLLFAIIAVFLGGLMIGRTPSYLGKKLGAFEMKMASIAILVPPLLVLAGTALAVGLDAGRSSIQDSGAHGFSEVLYAFSSAANNNGSAFAGLSANTPFYNTALGVAMWFGRFFVLLPVLAIAGSLATRRRAADGPGTLPTHSPLFVALLVTTVLLVGALTFLPALALGPVAEALS